MPWIEEVKVWRLMTKREMKELGVMKVFISYKRNAEPDEPLALYLYRFLKHQGHNVFIDQTIEIGAEWGREIQAQIETSDQAKNVNLDALDPTQLDAEETPQRGFDACATVGQPDIRIRAEVLAHRV